MGYERPVLKLKLHSQEEDQECCLCTYDSVSLIEGEYSVVSPREFSQHIIKIGFSKDQRLNHVHLKFLLL